MKNHLKTFAFIGIIATCFAGLASCDSDDIKGNLYTFTEKMMGMTAPTEISKEKFEKTFNEYRKDPLGSLRSSMTPEMLDQKAPGSETTMRERIKDQEKMLDKLYNSIDNPIEIISEHTPIKK